MIARILMAALLLATPAAAQTSTKFGWAPKPKAAPFIAPNRPHWRLADLLKTHARHKSWSQVLVRDADGLTATYIQSAPGEVSRRVMYSDTTIFFVVQSGQLRVVIDGVDSFIASKGFVVQVPALRLFHVETVGDAPALRFEVTQTLAPPVYADGQKPQAIRGKRFTRIGYYSPPAPYEGNNKPFVDFYKNIATGPVPGLNVVQDDFVSARISRAMPAAQTTSARKHFHLTSAFAFVLEGEMAYRIEGERDIAAVQGDLVYVPQGRWHSGAPAGTGMAAQLTTQPAASSLSLNDAAR